MRFQRGIQTQEGAKVMLILLAMPRSEEAKGCWEMLVLAGHTVFKASHGGRALEMTRESDYDVLITAEDFGRGRMNGAELIGYIRDRETSGHLRRLLIVMPSINPSDERLVLLVNSGQLNILLSAPLRKRDLKVISHFIGEAK